MKKLIALFVSMCTVTSLAEGVSAATWTKVGTCGFVFNTPGRMLNVYRQRFSSIVVDGQGNIYATANNDTNTAPNEGGLTIFKAGGGVTDVNLTAQGFPGAVTKLVAAGDSDQGVVYALQNWQELQFGYATGTPHRILRIASDGSVTQIWCPKKPAESGTCPVTDANMIGGMTVGGDGNVYWTASASDGYWKYNFFYRYDVFTGVVEAAPGDSADNDGHSEKHRLFDLEYVGDGWFAVIGRPTTDASRWQVEPMRWVKGQPRPGLLDNGIPVLEGTAFYDTANSVSAPGWGRDWLTASAYDPVHRQLWVGGRGTGGGNPTTLVGGTCIMTRWTGTTQNPGLIAPLPSSPSGDPYQGIVSMEMWHANGNDPLGGINNFSELVSKNYPAAGSLIQPQYWLQALAVNPDAGQAWMSYGASHTYTQSDIGHVMIRGPFISDYFDAGVPEQGAWVVGLTISGGKAYALACNMTTGVYSVYSTTDLTPSAPPPTVGGAKSSTTGVPASFSGIVTLPYPNDVGGNYMYVESPDRSAGIRVMTNDFGNPGFRVLVQGTTMLVNGEATITGSSITIDGIEEPLRPLHVAQRSIGGASPGVQSAVAPGAGLSTIGLLVTLTGRLTDYMPSDPSGIAFRIDDGSGALPGSATVPGIKVLGIPPSANTGAMLQVKGVIGVEMDGSTPVPVVRTQIGDVTLISDP